jgi:hypothetical protein
LAIFKRSKNSKYLKEQRKDVVSFYYAPKEAAKTSKYVFVWDLDKTYLDTHFESFSGLIRLIFEKALQKRNVPGTAVLVRALFKSDKHLPIYFISASPPQMQDKIKEKLDLDGITPYGFFSKDNLKNLRPARWNRLTNHIGFKLQALMEIRMLLSPECEMICWGDDSESDANIYSLFSDICSHRLTDREVISLLTEFGTLPDQIDLILELRDQREDFDPLKRVYINLAVDTDPEYYRRYGRRLMAVDNSFEVALDLFQRGFIDLESVLEICEDLRGNYKFKTFKLEQSYKVLCARKRIADVTDEILRPALKAEGFLGPNFDPEVKLAKLEKLPLVEDLQGIIRPWIPERIDYLSDY